MRNCMRTGSCNPYKGPGEILSLQGPRINKMKYTAWILKLLLNPWDFLVLENVIIYQYNYINIRINVF